MDFQSCFSNLSFGILSRFRIFNSGRSLIPAHQPYQLFSAGSCRIHRGHQRSVSQDCDPICQLHDLFQPVRHIENRSPLCL